MMVVTWLMAGVILQQRLNPDEARLVRIARQAVTASVQQTSLPVPDEASAPAAVFVTIEIGGKVRGCRGGLETRSHSLEEEVIHAAQSASSHDPRYEPLKASDLKEFKVTVTVIDRVEPVGSVDGLRPEDGLVLKAGDATGVVLPFEGRAPATRLQWAFRKAGVPVGTPALLFRMTARRVRG